jgi:hypothetical protein
MHAQAPVDEPNERPTASAWQNSAPLHGGATQWQAQPQVSAAGTQCASGPGALLPDTAHAEGAHELSALA